MSLSSGAFSSLLIFLLCIGNVLGVGEYIYWHSCSGAMNKTLHVGDHITWVWTDNNEHSVTCLGRGCDSESFHTLDSGDAVSELGFSYTYTFVFPGVYMFYDGATGEDCQSGSVVVETQEDCEYCSDYSCQFFDIPLDVTGVRDSRKVCGTSRVDGECHSAKTYQEAFEICEQDGLRLCSKKELETQETRGSGCGFDNDYIWSSSPCNSSDSGDSGLIEYYVVRGAGSASRRKPKCRSVMSEMDVRCCADDLAHDECCSSEDCRVCSRRSCGDLDLKRDNEGSRDSTSVCGASQLNGQCVRTSDYADAKQFCEANDMRLCTVMELENDEARDTGCNLDERFVWSSTSCGTDSFYVANGQYTGRDPECRKFDKRAGARCCADRRPNSRHCCDPVALNDECVSALRLNVPASISDTTELATSEIVPFYECTPPISEPSPGIWYRIIGTGQELRATTCVDVAESFAYDTQIAIFSGECSDLTCEVANDDDEECEVNSDLSTVTWKSEEGVTYYIFISGSDQQVGRFAFEVGTTLNLRNEDCRGAEQLTNGVRISGSTRPSRDPEPGLPSCFEFGAVNGVWYQTRRSRDEKLRVSTCSDNERIKDFDTHLNVFDGSCGDLDCVTSSSSDSSCRYSHKAAVEWDAKANVDYYVFVYLSGHGEFDLTFEAECSNIYEQCGGEDWYGNSNCCSLGTTRRLDGGGACRCTPERNLNLVDMEHVVGFGDCAGINEVCSGANDTEIECCEFTPQCLQRRDSDFFQCGFPPTEKSDEANQGQGGSVSVTDKLSTAAIVLSGISILGTVSLMYCYFSRRNSQYAIIGAVDTQQQQ